MNFAVNEPVSWMGYSLDAQDNVTITGNTTLTGLSNGAHNVTVYAQDTAGNIEVSENITFTIVKESEPEPFPTTLVAVASGASVVIIGVGLLFYFRKRNH